MTAIACALLAVMAAGEGDTNAATAHISDAQQHGRAAARRDRQVVEIAALVVVGDRARATGLALEHAAQFPEDTDLLARIAATTRPSGPAPRPVGALPQDPS